MATNAQDGGMTSKDYYFDSYAHFGKLSYTVKLGPYFKERWSDRYGFLGIHEVSDRS